MEFQSSHNPKYDICASGLHADELLNREIFTTLTEAKVLIADWRKEYNQIRPHSAKKYQPLAPEATLAAVLT